MTDDDFEAELERFLQAELPQEASFMLRATTPEGESETWDPAMLERDFHAVATELFLFAKDPSMTLVEIKKLAQQPPLYAQFIVDDIAARIGPFVLRSTATLEIEPLLTAYRWWVAICRQEGIVPHVYP